MIMGNDPSSIHTESGSGNSTEKPSGVQAAATNVEADSNKQSRKKLIENIKDYLDTLSSVIRVSLYFLGLAAISYIIWTTFSNQYHKKSIAVIVDPAAEKIFLNLDSNVDFRSTLINEINLRIDAFADVLKGFAAEQMLAREAPEDIPLKALGVDTSTNEINRITRNVFGISPAYEVRISAICPAGSCVFDNKTERVSVEAASKLTVVVDLRARDQHKRLSFPDIPVTNPALRRGLKNAIGKTSEELIALVDPLRASVLFLKSWNWSGRRTLLGRDQ